MPVRPSSAPAFSTSAAGYSVATGCEGALASRRGGRTGDLGHERGADARAILGGLLDQEPVYRRVEIDRRAADVARDVAFPDQHRDELFGVLTAARTANPQNRQVGSRKRHSRTAGTRGPYRRTVKLGSQSCRMANVRDAAGTRSVLDRGRQILESCGIVRPRPRQVCARATGKGTSLPRDPQGRPKARPCGSACLGSPDRARLPRARGTPVPSDGNFVPRPSAFSKYKILIVNRRSEIRFRAKLRKKIRGIEVSRAGRGLCVVPAKDQLAARFLRLRGR